MIKVNIELYRLLKIFIKHYFELPRFTNRKNSKRTIFIT